MTEFYTFAYDNNSTDNDMVNERDKPADNTSLEQKKLEEIENKLKNGDFSVKPELIELMKMPSDTQVQNECIRLFLCVANNEELHNVSNLAFLEDAEEDAVHTFSTYSVYSLSYETVPYLFMLFEIWEDTNMEDFIRSSLDYILSYSDHMDFYASLEEIENWAVNVIGKSQAEQYYYMNQTFHPVILAKKIHYIALNRLANNAKFAIFTLPEILELSTGKAFPVAYDEIVDETAIRKIHNYIESLILIPWETGAKYYLGHKVV